MPRAVRAVTYHGEVMTVAECARRTGIHFTAIYAWLRLGQFTDAKIDELLKLREMREVAVKNNLDLRSCAMRRHRGMSLEASYLTPRYGRRKQKESVEHG